MHHIVIKQDTEIPFPHGKTLIVDFAGGKTAFHKEDGASFMSEILSEHSSIVPVGFEFLSSIIYFFGAKLINKNGMETLIHDKYLTPQ